MEDFETEKIERYGKQDLFRRFALDHFAALHQLVTKRSPIRKGLRSLYESVLDSCGAEALDNRLLELRMSNRTADWQQRPPG
jgi:hypothetical protein